MRLWRVAFVLLWFATIPINLFAGSTEYSVLSFFSALGVLVILFVWSIVAAVNAERARPSSVHIHAPGPAKVLLAWLMLPLVFALFVGVSLALGETARNLGPGDFESARNLEGATIVVVIFFIVALCIAVYCPYGVLRAISRYVGGNHTLFLNWFFAPILAGILGFTLLIGVGLSLGASGSDGAGIVGSAATVVALALPPIAWIIVGLRAMTDLEESLVRRHVKTASERRGAAGGVSGLTPAQQAAIAIQNTAPSAPSA